MDTELSANGISQCLELKRILRETEFQYVLSSDLKRASQSASMVVLDREIRTDFRLRERNFGTLCGKPREKLQQFAETNAESDNLCQGWRDIGGECTHEMATRTLHVLQDLCSEMTNRRVLAEKPVVDATSTLILGYPEHPGFPESFSAFLKEKNSDIKTVSYAGHALLVSHGGFIRQLLRLLVLHADQSFAFPRHCINNTISNCAVCQLAIACIPPAMPCSGAQLEILKRVGSRGGSAGLLDMDGVLRHTPIPSFRGVVDKATPNCLCPFLDSANPRLSILTHCYHYNKTVLDFSGGRLAQEAVDSPAERLCANMEVIFAGSDDEYAGLPEPSNEPVRCFLETNQQTILSEL